MSARVPSESFRAALRESAGAPAGIAAMTVLGAAILLGIRTPWSSLMLQAATALLVVSAVWLEVRLLRGAYPTLWMRRQQAPEPGALPEQLERLSRTAELAPSSPLDLWVRLRPLLQPIVRDRLRRSRHVDLDREPDRAREIVGERLDWLVGPSRVERPGAGPRFNPNAVEELVAAVAAMAGDADR
ncbi:MAG: hypothetical protein ACREQM_09015 [Candidatus Dormibacteraceae bacterium]